MKETPAQFERRTGRRYDPPHEIAAAGRRLDPDEPCPTLFRYPGPAALLAFIRGGLEPLGPAERSFTWFGSDPAGFASGGGELFGVIAVLDPVSLDPCATEILGQWLASPRKPETRESALWIPAREIEGAVRWDETLMARDAATVIPSYEATMAAAAGRLSAYVEELSALSKAGAAGPSRPWCEVGEDERKEILAASGVEPLWTGMKF